MNFTLCVLFIMTMGLCKHFVHNALTQYTKDEIHFINNIRCMLF